MREFSSDDQNWLNELSTNFIKNDYETTIELFNHNKDLIKTIIIKQKYVKVFNIALDFDIYKKENISFYRLTYINTNNEKFNGEMSAISNTLEPSSDNLLIMCFNMSP